MDDLLAMTEPRHPIGVVARRTGLDLHVLRAWERRYGAVVPWRSPTGRRLYADLDVERLRLMKRLAEAGRRISDVANRSLDELRSLASEDAAAGVVPVGATAPPPPGSAPRDGRPAHEILRSLIAAVEALDRSALDRLLAEAAAACSGPRLRQEILVPLLEGIGERWQEGSLRIVHEHLASEALRGFLAPPRAAAAAGAPRLVVTTPAGQLHEFGALLAAAAATEAGWDVRYLGPNLPAEEIAAGVAQSDARAVVLSLVFPLRDPALREELRRLRACLGPDIPVLAGGRAAESYAGELATIGALRLADLPALVRELLRLGGDS